MVEASAASRTPLARHANAAMTKARTGVLGNSLLEVGFILITGMTLRMRKDDGEFCFLFVRKRVR